MLLEDSLHVTSEEFTIDSLATLQEREMEVGVIAITVTLGWPGSGTKTTNTCAILYFRVCLTECETSSNHGTGEVD